MTLSGRRFLIVEDEAIIAMMRADAIEGAGGQVLRSVGTVAEALAAIDSLAPDAVLLDLQLGVDDALPVASRLQALGIPYVICTGFGEPALPPDIAPHQVVSKPVEFDALLAALESLPPAR